MLAELAAAFGAEILNEDGSLNRAALGERVFRDASERARLNAIVHPAFGVDFDRRIALLVESNVEMLVLDIPLLFEGRSSGQGYAARRHFDATVLVWVPEALQVERTMSRDGSTEEQARLRIQAQMPLSEKRELADHVILNDGTLADTEAQVQEVFRKLRLLPTRETSQEKP